MEPLLLLPQSSGVELKFRPHHGWPPPLSIRSVQGDRLTVWNIAPLLTVRCISDCLMTLLVFLYSTPELFDGIAEFKWP